MGARRDGKEGAVANLPPLKNVQGYIRFIYEILVRTERTKIVPEDTFHVPTQNIPKLPRTHTALPQIPTCI